MKKKSQLQKRIDDPRSRYWQKKADGAFVEYQRIEWKNTCAVCRQLGVQPKGNVEVHHLISRAIRSVRHNPRNGICLCSFHHKFSPELSAHGAPLAFSAWLMKHHVEVYLWATENKWKNGSFDYRKSYEELTKLIEMRKSQK